MTAKAGRGKNTRCRFTNGDFFQTFDRLWATLHQVLHRQWLDLFTIISSPRNFAERLYCDVSLPPSYLSCLVSSSSPVTYSIYSHTNYIHTFIHQILSYIHICTHPCVHSMCTISIHTWLH